MQNFLKSAAIVATIAIPSASYASVISVDFNAPKPSDAGPNSPTMAGVESAAAAANSSFGASNIWNGIVGQGFEDTNTGLSVSGLLDSTGLATSVGFQTSESLSFSFASPMNPLRADYLFWNGRGRPDTATWSITGLMAGAEYSLYVYATSSDVPGRTSSVTVDTNGDMSLADDLGMPLVDPLSDAYFSSVFADSNGTISGANLALIGEGNWSGFQLASVTPVPLPAGLPLLLAGIGGLGVLARRKRKG